MEVIAGKVTSLGVHASIQRADYYATRRGKLEALPIFLSIRTVMKSV